MKKLSLFVSALFAVTGVSAEATPVSKRLLLTASDFTYWAYSNTPDPVNDFTVDFTVNFDTSQSFNTLFTNGPELTINASTAPTTWSLSYDSFGGRLTLATLPLAAGCGMVPSSFCVFIDNIATSPQAVYVEQSTSTGGMWNANNISLQEITGPAVPEVATWAMLVVGFAGIGAVMRKSNRRASRVSWNAAHERIRFGEGRSVTVVEPLDEIMGRLNKTNQLPG